MTDVSALEARLDHPARRTLAWAGPALFGLLGVLGAVNRWVAPIGLGSVVDGSLLALLLPIVLLASLALAVEFGIGDSDHPTWKRSVAASGAGLLGGVLLVAAWGKLLDPQAFSESIAAEGLDFVLPAMVIAVIAVGIEVGLGAALVLGLRRLWLLGASSLLVLFFLFLTGRAYWRFAHGIVDETSSCGCFGSLIERTPAEAFWQDLILLAPGLVLAYLVVDRSSASGRRLAVAAAVTLLAVGLAVAAPSLPLDDFATRLHPGVEMTEICSGSGDARICLSSLNPELLDGEHVVLLTRIDDPVFIESVEDLNSFFLEPDLPGLVVLSTATAEELQTFFWQFGPSFEIAETPEPMMRPLYRTLPRSFLVADGRVEETFEGMPPLASLRAR